MLLSFSDQVFTSPTKVVIKTTCRAATTTTTMTWVVAIRGCRCRRLCRTVWSGGLRTRWRKQRLEISTCRSWLPRCIIAVMAYPEMPRRSISFNFLFNFDLNFIFLRDYICWVLFFWGLGFGHFVGSLFFLGCSCFMWV